MRLSASNQYVLHSPAEICLNLWFFVDKTGVVLRLAGKAYALAGSDEEKLVALRMMAGTDHLTATHGSVPDRFELSSEHGNIEGAIPASSIVDDQLAVFGPLIDQIERELPKSIRSVNDRLEQFTVVLSKDPLSVVTAVIEREDGELVAKVPANH